MSRMVHPVGANRNTAPNAAPGQSSRIDLSATGRRRLLLLERGAAAELQAD